MIKRIGFLIFLLFRIPLAGEEMISLSPYPWMKVTYEGEARVYNSRLDKLPRTDPFYHAQGDTGHFIKVLEYIPDSADGDRYSILFSMGESGDSQYLFYREGSFDEPHFILHCDHLHFRGDGILIAQASTNRMFPQSQKYALQKGRIRELPQPFYAIGLESVAMRDLEIYAGKRMEKVIDTVREGEKVTILAAEFKENPERYLIRNARGLCGWIRIPHGVWVDETPVRDIYYHGD
ncbi:MAG: hypothetical protein PHX07_02180 [Candidatus Marinimicrobia bacterium]|nr:hypothetical protein [Candidatus Neomarinimicrobiota bacterium]MDD4961024.1 hypothetical protein [Candidatus Neomarinimicrobiota bacterium]MDD5710137.1 hypothetical protein [Candidatus Neomarinimicrobiota bacterium]